MPLDLHGWNFRQTQSHQAQEPPSESLPAEPGIRQSASWRSYNGHRPHQSRQQRPADIATQPPHDVTDLNDPSAEKPVATGTINECRHTA
ncbi:hypothetical protein GCM10022419_114530 [Nonomuraea rosea]|uniref:Transposase n=1 Tax=Nonomuraea rosea TaxID=638574 RepID=A0ABP6ZL84_9ACTN